MRIPQTKRGGGHFVAIVPVKHGEPAPQFATLAGGKAIQVKFADGSTGLTAGRTDTIVLQKDKGEVELNGQKVNGTALLITEQGGKRTVTDLAR